MALTGDIVVDDGAVLTLEGDAADLAALQDDPQSIVLNGGVLDLSDFATWQSGTSYNDGLAVSGSSVTVIGSPDVVESRGATICISAATGWLAWQTIIVTWAPRKSLPVRWW